MLVVDYASGGRLRACAQFDKARVAAAIARKKTASADLLGRGHLAMTIDQGADMSRYQGVVALEGGGLEEAAHEYFRRSEQIPTRVRLAVAEEFRSEPDSRPTHRWRAGGIMVQFLPKASERMRVADLDPGDAPEGFAKPEMIEDDAWVEGRSLVETVEDIELIDPALSTERLVYRLFHERGVRVFDAAAIVAQCSCSRDSVEAMLRSFTQDDRDHMVEDGRIGVTCEFCNRTYTFDPDEVRQPGPAVDVN
jgi:molecular chaperone Hsp33